MSGLRVSEMFYSLQGEGPSIGTPAIFLRLQGCNLLCQWCDTLEVWRRGGLMTWQEIVQVWRERGWWEHLVQEHAHIVLTGGEPLLQKRELQGFIEVLILELGKVPYIEVESNATMLPGSIASYVQQFNLSPKLANSGMERTRRYKPEVLQQYAGMEQAYFKFVVQSPADWHEIEQDFVRPFSIPRQRIFLMPEAQTREELQARRIQVAELCKRTGCRYSDRLQLAIWDRATGV